MTNYILQQIKDRQLKSTRVEQLPYLKIMDSEPLLPSMEDKKYDYVMEHIRQLLDKRKPRTMIIQQSKAKGGKSLNKRHMVDVRFKEQYLSRQQVQTQVTHDSMVRDSQTARDQQKDRPNVICNCSKLLKNTTQDGEINIYLMIMNQIVSGIQFNVGARYEVKKLLGAGAYGHVALAIDKKQPDPDLQKVAIKKLHLVRDEIDAKRVLREIRILRTMKHENILHLEHLIYDDSNKELEFGEVYLVTNYMEVDLYKIIKSGQNLTDQHFQYIMYQLIKALKYLHSANIVHRDIKPSNILATENCEICFCDFGLARQIEDGEADDNKYQNMLTEYVVTRYYRAPEVMLSSHEYTTAIDMWSLGCTFAELLTRQILFKGTNYIQMIKLIFDTLGKPEDEDLTFITNANAKKYVNSLQTKPKSSLATVIKYSNPLALDLLDKLLEINPKKRINSTEALNHPYLEPIRDADDEPSFEGNLDCNFENDNTIQLKDLKALILNEVNLMRQKNNEPIINVQLEIEKREQIAKINLQKKQQLKAQQQKQ